MDLSALAVAYPNITQYGSLILTLIGICSVIIAHVPPPSPTPTTAFGKLWLGVYNVINFVAQNVHYGVNANDPHTPSNNVPMTTSTTVTTTKGV
jgi:hypothetical protein